MKRIRNCCMALCGIALGGNVTNAQGGPPPPLPTTQAVLARLEAIAASTNDWEMKLRLKYMAASLRVGFQRKKIRRGKRMKPATAGRTSGEDGEQGSALLPGWGPRQIIEIGDPAFKKRQRDLKKACVQIGKLKQADLHCFLTDLMLLTLIHEWVHVQQRSAIPLDDAAHKAQECEAYRIGCYMTGWFLTGLPKYAGPHNACSLARLMALEARACTGLMMKECL